MHIWANHNTSYFILNQSHTSSSVRTPYYLCEALSPTVFESHTPHPAEHPQTSAHTFSWTQASWISADWILKSTQCRRMGVSLIFSQTPPGNTGPSACQWCVHHIVLLQWRMPHRTWYRQSLPSPGTFLNWPSASFRCAKTVFVRVNSLYQLTAQVIWWCDSVWTLFHKGRLQHIADYLCHKRTQIYLHAVS